MKNSLLFLFMLFVTGMTYSCGKDESVELPVQVSSNTLVGTWDALDIYTLGYENDQVYVSDTLHFADPDYLKLILTADTSFEIKSAIQGADQDQKGQYQLSLSQLLLKDTLNGGSFDVYDYVLNGDTLLLTNTTLDTLNNLTYRIINQIVLQRE